MLLIDMNTFRAAIRYKEYEAEATLQTLAYELPSRHLSPAQLHFRRHCQDGRKQYACRVGEANRPNLKLAFLPCSLSITAGSVVALLIDAIEDVDTGAQSYCQVLRRVSRKTRTY